MAITSPLAQYYSSFGNDGKPGFGSADLSFYNSTQIKTGDTKGLTNFGGLSNAGGGYFGPASQQFAPSWTPNSQASTKDFSRNSTRETYGILDQTRFSNEQLFSAQEGYIAKAANARVAGIDAALAETDRVSQAGYQRARDYGIGAAGAADQDLFDSGLYNSSERLNAQRGVAGDTFRRFLAVDEAYSGVRSKLQAQRGQATAQGYENLSNFYERVRSTNEASYLYEFDARLGRGIPQTQKSQDSGTDWGSIIGTLAAILLV